jgi:hypothetical protein
VAPLAERALDRWDDPSVTGWADAAATAATCRYLLGRPADAIDLATRALPHATASHYAPCTLRRVIGHASVSVGDVDRAVEVLSEAIGVAAGRVPALASEMTVSRAELAATLAEAASESDATVVLSEQREVVAAIAAQAAADGATVNEIWARTVEATLLVRVDRALARDAADRARSAASSAGYPAAESVNLHTLAAIAIDDGDLVLASSLIRRLIDGLVARGAERELRNGLRLAAVVLERVAEPAWRGLAATAASLPVVSLFSLPGRERHPLPPPDAPPLEVRAAVAIARAALDTVADSREPDAQQARQVVGAATPARAVAANEWCREGDLWRLSFDGLTVRVRASKGLVSIGRLLAAPETEIHCLDLADSGLDDRSSGDVIDARARREYEQRVRDLQVEVDEAEADADFHRADRARAELDAIVDHLTAALGLGGRTRRQTDTTERARSAVTQLIRSTIRRLRSSHPTLADHLEVSIQTGVYCRYRPDRSIVWSTAGPVS